MTERKEPSTPSSWCQETRELYDPVRPLGVGGFGSVWLAKKKKKPRNHQNDDTIMMIDDDEPQLVKDCVADNNTQIEDEEGPHLVAIKVVGHPHNQKISSKLQYSEEGYFHREVSVLQEISHPRIIHCLKVIEDTDPNSSCAPYCMVLEYCQGPTVEQLIKHGGALGIHMAQEVSSQLIDAVSFLHGRAVIHRDIKPDNIIVNGAKLSDDACYSDESEGSMAAKLHRWNIKLVDFGFARPLRPEDILDKKSLLKRKEPRDEFFGRSTVDNQLDDRSIHHSRFGLDLSISRGKENNDLSLSSSISRNKVRNLSAVGNRIFAAPEIKKGIRVFKLLHSKKKVDSTAEAAKQPLSECVSDYSMIVDAFSTGATIRYMCTGAPPNVSVEEFILEKNSMINVLGRKIKKAVNKDYANKRQKRYRYNKDLPPNAVRLILGLTHWNEKKRTTVRSARDYEWVNSSYSMKSSKAYDPFGVQGGDLDFLKCATTKP